MIAMCRPRRIEGYAIVSEDGMLANASGIMPDQLKFEADQRFFERGLDGVDVVVHGRHSHERQRRSDLRRRLILTRKVAAIADDPLNKKALFWNPAGASLEQAMTVLGVVDGSVGVIGGTDVFGLFLDRYDVFYLSSSPRWFDARQSKMTLWVSLIFFVTFTVTVMVSPRRTGRWKCND